MLFIDLKYLRKLKLEGFKKLNENTYNFRCPFCGDSKKSRFKKRGYLLKHKRKDTLYYICHNECGANFEFSLFLKKLNVSLWNLYIKEISVLKFRKPKIEEKETVEEPKPELNVYSIKNADCISELNQNHLAFQYLQKRKINSIFYQNIYYVENYKKWINNNYIQGKYNNDTELDPRIIFPIYDIDKNLIGVQGRSIEENKIRYYTIKLVEDSYLCYGIDRLQCGEQIFVTEGIFDALFLKNSIAMLSLNISQEFLNTLKTDDIIFVIDNEPRNKEVVSHYKHIANHDTYGLFIWPRALKTKDLNELVCKEFINTNVTIQQLTDFVKQHSVFGKLSKNLAVSKWLFSS